MPYHITRICILVAAFCAFVLFGTVIGYVVFCRAHAMVLRDLGICSATISSAKQTWTFKGTHTAVTYQVQMIHPSVWP